MWSLGSSSHGLVQGGSGQKSHHWADFVDARGSSCGSPTAVIGCELLPFEHNFLGEAALTRGMTFSREEGR